MSDLIPRGRVDAATRSEALAVLHAYADGDLLTRVEAANDPEVQRVILGREYGQIALENDVSGYLHIVAIDNVKAGVYYLVEVTDDE